MHFTNSTLKFKVPPYSNISCSRCNDQLLEGDHKLHFDLSGGRGCNESLNRSVLDAIYVLRERSQKRECFGEGQSSGPLSREELQSAMSSQNGSFSFGSPEKVVGLQAQTYIAFLYSLQKIAVQSHYRTSRQAFGDRNRWV